MKYLSQFRQFCARVHGDVFLLADMTMQDPLEKKTSSSSCVRHDYELKRLTHFVKCMDINGATVDLKKTEMSTAENEKVESLKKSLIPLINNCNKLIEEFESGKRPAIEAYDELQAQAQEILDCLKSLRLPQVKPRWAEFTDAGPGVGVNNIDVKFRSAELDRIYDRDYRIRVHRSRGDSGHNEAGRTNSAIGDAVIDGATLDWEHYKRFQDMSEDSIANLTLQDYEKYEEQRMKRMLGGLPANSLNVLMVLLFCLIRFTQVFQTVQKTLSF